MTPSERTYCKEILKEADKACRVTVLSNAMIGLMRHFRSSSSSLTFAGFEVMLRELESRSFLIAAPKRISPPGIRVLDPLAGRPRQYVLWICLNGKGEALSTMSKFGIASPRVNFEHLKVTGVWTVR